MSAIARAAICAFLVALGAPASGEAQEAADADSTGVTAAADSTGTPGAAAADSLALLPVPGFGPRDAAAGAFLRPTPGPRRPSEAMLTPFDAFLLPPEGPARFFDRSDLRLTGPTEWWDLAYLVPGLFTLRPGYPGTATPFSFRAHGPEGTMILYDGRPLAGGYTPDENPAPIGRGHLAGAAVMRVGASHLYGPGAGAGALQLMPVDGAPRGAFSEAATMSGIFGQRSGAFTTAFHFSGVGVLFEYDGAGANAWTLFDGYRAEHAHGRLDWRSGGTHVTASARTIDEKLKHFERLEKRSDDGGELTLAVEHVAGPWLGAVRGVRHTSTLRADGPQGTALQDLERWRGEALVRRTLGDRGDVGLMGGIFRDRRERRDVFAREQVAFGTGGYALARMRLDVSGVRLDAAGRFDHLATGQDAVAAGVTATRSMGARALVWLHAARTVDRPAYAQRITDAYTQIEQGVDLPWEAGRELPAGLTGAGGVSLTMGRLSLELGGSKDRYDRQWAFDPDPADTTLALDDPQAWRTTRVSSVGGWAELSFGPLWLGRVLGSFACGGSAFLGSAPDVRTLHTEPHRTGGVWGRLRKDLFKGALRLEGEVDWEALGEIAAIGATFAPQSQLTARVSAQIGDAILYYRSENILNQDFLSSAYDAETGYVKITSQNVIVGISWVLLD